MDRLLNIIEARDRLVLESFLSDPPHGMLITAPRGFGVNEIARELAYKLDDSFVQVMPEAKNKSSPKITVSSIRTLTLSSATKNKVLKVYVIFDADKMTSSAQNAFLKALEEPSVKTMFILATEDDSKLLATVKSRLRVLSLSRLSTESSKKLLRPYNLNNESKKQILFLGNGLPKTLLELASSADALNERRDSVTDSKLFLSGNIYQKLLIVNKYKDNRIESTRLIDDCLIILSSLLGSQTDSKNLRSIEILLKARDRVLANGNTRLILMEIVLQ